MAVRTMSLPVSLPAFDRKYVFGGLLAAIAAILVLVATQPPERTPVLVAGVDLPAGVPLGELDLEVRYVEGAEGHVVGDEVGELADWSLTYPLAAGEPLIGSALRPPAMKTTPHMLAMSLPPQNAVLGRLAAGDAVDIYLTVTEGEAPIEADRIAESVYVVEASVSESPGSMGDVELILAVDDERARGLTAAARTGRIDLVRVGP